MKQLKTNTAPSRSQLKIAGHLTNDDKQVLKDYAATLKQRGTRSAAKELEKMNKMYATYGMSFGKIEGV